MGIALEDSSRMGLSLPGLALAQRFYSLANSHDWENDGTQALMKIFVRSMQKESDNKRRFPKSKFLIGYSFNNYANISYRRSRFFSEVICVNALSSRARKLSVWIISLPVAEEMSPTCWTIKISN